MLGYYQCSAVDVSILCSTSMVKPDNVCIAQILKRPAS